MEFSKSNLEKVAFLLEAATNEQSLYFQDLKKQLDQWGTKILESLINFHQLKSNNSTLKNLIGANNTISNVTSLDERLTEIEQQQERISKHLDKFISLLTYPDQVQDQFKALWDAIEDIKNQPERVELLKGIMEIPRGEVIDLLEFYTIKANGECGMSQSTLAKLAGVSQQAMSKLENTLTTKSPSHYLQSYTGQELTLTTSDQVNLTIDGQYIGNLTIYKSDYCAAVITHYAMKGNKTALHNLGNFCLIGIAKWIQDITGYAAK